MSTQTERVREPERSRSGTRSNNSHGRENERRSRDSSLHRPSRENSVLRKNIAPKANRDLLHTALNHQILLKNHNGVGRTESSNSSTHERGERLSRAGLSAPQEAISNVQITPETFMTYREPRSISLRPFQDGATDNLYRSLSNQKSESIDLGFSMYRYKNEEDSLKADFSSISSNVKEFYPSTASGNISNYQSESDDPSESDEEINAWTYPVIENSVEFKNLNTIINEINEFQSNFKSKHIESDRPSAEGKHSRVQQKILDYKELHHNGSSASLASMDHKTLFSAYDYKKQHEIITHQYNSLRLRFPTKIVSRKNQLKLNVGIWGFLNRFKNLLLDPSSRSSVSIPEVISTPTLDDPPLVPISKSTKDDYLAKLWSQELGTHFRSHSKGSPERSLSVTQPPVPQTPVPVTPISNITQVAKSPLTN